MKFPGNGHITKSELDAFLKAFEDEVFNLLVVRIWATPCTRLWYQWFLIASFT